MDLIQASTRAGLREEEEPLGLCTAAKKKAGTTGSQKRRGGEVMNLAWLGPEQGGNQDSLRDVAWML